MDFLINDEELARLSGLSHLQQLAYLRGIRPYMDVKTGLVGVKRRISHQSIAEQLYVEPHQGTKSQSFSRDQVRRSIAGLVRAGIVTVQSEDMQLILKCELATAHYCVQNKAAINPPQKAAINQPEVSLVNIGLSEVGSLKADILEPQKAATPLKSSYLYFLFDKFWESYPQKKSKQKAQDVFEQLNPDHSLFEAIMQALEAQINHVALMQLRGSWVPPWKYPANWLTQRCWEDELSTELLQEQHHAEHTKNTKSRDTNDMFCPPCDTEERETNNVIPFKQYR